MNRDFETSSFLFFFLSTKHRFNHYSEEQIKKYQLKKVRNIVKYAYNNSKFFHNLYKGYNLDDIASLPTINKKIMMDNLTDYNTVGLNKEELINFCLETERTRDFSKRFNNINIGMSSGTSGNKGIIITTKREENYLRAAFFSRFSFIKGEKLNLAFILRVTVPAFNINKFGHRLTYISQLNPIEKVVSQLNELQPNIVSAPPSMLYILAKEKEGNRLNINPKKLISYAEILYPEVKQTLINTFNCPTHEIYQCSEGSIAISCNEGSLHINEDLVALELLNADGTPTPISKPCQKLIITDLHKTSQPVIRYELNDLITISPKKCKCGSSFRVIESVQGRSDDLFIGEVKTNKTFQYIFPDYISRSIITASEDIEEYQAIQKTIDKVLIRILVNEKANKDNIISLIIKNIKNVFSSYNCVEPEIEILFEKPIKNVNSFKLIRIHREFNI